MHSLTYIHQRLLKVHRTCDHKVCFILNLTKVAQSTDPLLQWHLRMLNSAKFYLLSYPPSNTYSSAVGHPFKSLLKASLPPDWLLYCLHSYAVVLILRILLISVGEFNKDL